MTHNSGSLSIFRNWSVSVGSAFTYDYGFKSLETAGWSRRDNALSSQSKTLCLGALRRSHPPEVGLQLVGGANGGVDDADIHVAVIVKIAELDGPHSVQTGGQALQSDRKAGDLHIAGVEIEGAGSEGGQAGSAKGGGGQELPAGQTKLALEPAVNHSP